MKSKFKILTVIAVMIFAFNDCYSQKPDTVKKGSYYDFILNDGSEITGKIIFLDSSVILVKTPNGLNEIQRHRIKSIGKTGQDFLTDYYTSYRKPEYRKYISLNLGMVLPENANNGEEYYSYYSKDLNTGFSLSFAYTAFFNRNIAIRTGASYANMKNKDSPETGSYYYERSTGGNLSQILIHIDMLAGFLEPENNFNYYALGGFGFGSMNSSKVTENYYYGGNQSYDPETQWTFMYRLGAGVTYRKSEKLAFQFEIDYDIVSPEGGFYEKINQLGIKAGVVFISF